MKKFSSLLLLSQFAFASNSLLALKEGGLNDLVGHAAFKGMADAGHALPEICAYDAQNVAALGLCDKVGFGASLFMEDFKVDGGTALASNQLALGSFSAFFPTRYFALGLGYDQKSPRYFKVATDSLEWNLYGGKSSAHLGLAIPFGATGFSLGFKGAMLTGSTREDLTWLKTSTAPNQKIKRHMVDDYSGAEYATGMQFQNNHLGLYGQFSYLSPVDIGRTSTLTQLNVDTSKTIEGSVGTSSYPDLNLVQKSAQMDANWNLAGGTSVKLGDLNRISLDGHFAPAQGSMSELLDPNGQESQLAQGENDPAWGLSLGYGFGNSPRAFDSWIKKASLRTGIAYRSLGYLDAKEYKLSLGFGMPLGNRGSRLDLATELGQRQASGYQYEQFAAVWVSLHGFGNWGKPSRRYR